MSDWQLKQFDVCYCGDYRHQHDLRRGCRICRCLTFFLSKTATKIPEPYNDPSFFGPKLRIPVDKKD